MELKQKNLTIEDRINNLDGDKRTRQFVLGKKLKEIPEGIYTRNTYYSYREAMYKFIKGILSEKEAFESLYKEIKDGEEDERLDNLLKEIGDRIYSLDEEFDSALEKLGNWAEFFMDKREKMRTLPNDKRLELMLHGVDCTVLEIVFEREEE